MPRKVGSEEGSALCWMAFAVSSSCAFFCSTSSIVSLSVATVALMPADSDANSLLSRTDTRSSRLPLVIFFSDAFVSSMCFAMSDLKSHDATSAVAKISRNASSVVEASVLNLDGKTISVVRTSATYPFSHAATDI